MQNKDQTNKELTLILLYLNSWHEKHLDDDTKRSWKGYDFNILDALSEENFIYSSKKAKSVYLNKQGIQKAEELLEKYGIGPA